MCDLAETYGIYDYRSLPASKIATFFVGLGHNSRTKMKLSGYEYPLETMLLAKICDAVSMLLWFNSEDGANGKNRPKSMLCALLDIPEHDDELKPNEDFMSFDTIEDYEAYRKKKVGG